MGGIVATRKWLSGAGAGALVVAISLAIDDPHMSDTVSNAVKVNARIQGCSFPADTMSLTVQLWKTGFFTDYLQRQTTANGANTGYLANNDMYVKCTNTKTSTYYGTADGQIVLSGNVYTASVYSVHTFTTSCGT